MPPPEEALSTAHPAGMFDRESALECSCDVVSPPAGMTTNKLPADTIAANPANLRTTEIIRRVAFFAAQCGVIRHLRS